MKFYDALGVAAKNRGIPLDRLSLLAGFTSSRVSAAKSRGSIPQVNTAVKLTSACGYSVCAIPKGEEPDCAIVIDKAGLE